jgi:hypothetical protein
MNDLQIRMNQTDYGSHLATIAAVEVGLQEGGCGRGGTPAGWLLSSSWKLIKIAAIIVLESHVTMTHIPQTGSFRFPFGLCSSFFAHRFVLGIDGLFNIQLQKNE